MNKYEELELEILMFEQRDVIITSGEGNDDPIGLPEVT